MKYKVGDKVKIVDEFKNYMVATKGFWIGKIMTIDFVDRTTETYFMKEDDGKHVWFDDDIDGLIQDAEFKEKFKLYDTVKHKHYGLGTIICFDKINLIGVDFDEYNPALHDLCGKCKYGHGYWLTERELEKVK